MVAALLIVMVAVIEALVIRVDAVEEARTVGLGSLVNCPFAIPAEPRNAQDTKPSAPISAPSNRRDWCFLGASGRLGCLVSRTLELSIVDSNVSVHNSATGIIG